jgi:S1-C subfamily serine protease
LARTLAACAFSIVALCVAGRPALADTLPERYQRLSCAVVRIETSEGMGTGFFTDAEGTLATAAHVVFTREVRQSGAQARLSVELISELTLEYVDGRKQAVKLQPLGQHDADLAVFDLALLKTGLKSPCFIPIGHAGAGRIGDHVIAIGFPGSSSTGVLYEGFISSLHIAAPTTIGLIKGTDKVYQVTKDLMRVQMPITRGASGSPVISEADEAIGVVSEIPIIWTQELARLVQGYATKGSGTGVFIGGFDTTKLLAQLAWVVSEFEAPGAGLAVPLSYLDAPPYSNPPPANAPAKP